MRALTKSELIDKVFARHGSLTNREADEAVNEILKTIISAMSHGVRVEVRGFGSFSLKHRAARTQPPDGCHRRSPGQICSALPCRQRNP